MIYWMVIYLFCTLLTIDIKCETLKHFQIWHPLVRLLAHIKEYNKHGCHILLNFAIKSENKRLLSKWNANYNHFLPLSQWWSQVSLVRIHQLAFANRMHTRAHFYNLWRGDLENMLSVTKSFKSFSHSNYTIDKVYLNPSTGLGDWFWLKFDILMSFVTLEIGSRSQKSNHSFPPSQTCIHVSLVRIHPFTK